MILGVFAFAVDFSAGAISLPHGKPKTAKGSPHHELAVLNTSPSGLNLAKLDKILMDYTGEEITSDSETVLVYEADSKTSNEKQLRKPAQ